MDRDHVHERRVVRGSDGKDDDVADVSAETMQLWSPRNHFAHRQHELWTGDHRGVVWPSYGDERGGGLL